LYSPKKIKTNVSQLSNGKSAGIQGRNIITYILNILHLHLFPSRSQPTATMPLKQDNHEAKDAIMPKDSGLKEQIALCEWKDKTSGEVTARVGLTLLGCENFAGVSFSKGSHTNFGEAVEFEVNNFTGTIRMHLVQDDDAIRDMELDPEELANAKALHPNHTDVKHIRIEVPQARMLYLIDATLPGNFKVVGEKSTKHNLFFSGEAV
jgi:hypothetical protein